MTHPTSYGPQDLAHRLKCLGLREGDCVFVHTALRALGRFNVPEGRDGLECLLECFLQAIGDKGTLIVPAFNFGFCQGGTYDYDNTPGEGLGVFAEFVRTRPEAVRSMHPFHSVAAVGSLARSVGEAEGFSEFSEGSAFDLLLKNNVKVLFFGVKFVETFVHVAEERCQVPYRFWKVFTSDCVLGGRRFQLSANFYARKLQDVPEPRVDVPRIGRFLLEQGVIAEAPLGAGSVGLADGNRIVDSVSRELTLDPVCTLIGYGGERMRPSV